MFLYDCCHFGENHVATIPGKACTQVGLLDHGMHFAFRESAKGSQRLTVNGEAGRWYEEITNLVFSPFPGYFYNLEHNGDHGFVLNGQEHGDRDCRCWELALNDVALWTCAEPQGKTRTFIGERELQHHFSRDAQLTADYRAFIYIGLDNEADCNELLVCGDEVLFQGSVLECEVHGDRTRLSWVGALPGSEVCQPYLQGRSQSRTMDILCYSPLSFTVCPLHRRYLLGEHETHLGPIRVVVDGEALPFQFPESTLFESGFSADSRSWYCLADQDDGNTSVLRDGRLLGVNARATNAQFIGEHLIYTAQPQGEAENSPWRLFRDGKLDAQWAGYSIEPDTLRSTETGDIACVGREKSADADAASLLFLLNGKPLWSFDALPRTDSAYFGTDASPIRFLADGRALCAGIKQGELMVFVADR